MPGLTDITVTLNQDTTTSTQATKAAATPDVMQIARDFLTNGGKAAEYMEKHCTDDFTIQFGEMSLPKAAMVAACKSCAVACPDMEYNANNFVLNDDGTVTVDVEVCGTHTGEAFTFAPDVPAIPTSGVRCRNDPERVQIFFNAAGKMTKNIVTMPKGVTRGFSGPPGWYAQMKKSASTVEVLNNSLVIQVVLSESASALPSTSDGLNFTRPIAGDAGSGGIYMWKDEKSMKAFNAANNVAEASSRSFNILRNVTRKTFDAVPGRSFSDARAVLVINGTVADGVPIDGLCQKFDGEMSDEAGKTYGSIPGVIAKNILCGSSANVDRVVGGCYLFENMQAIDNYLAGPVWGAVKDDTSMWHNVKIQRFNIPIDAGVQSFLTELIAAEADLGAAWTKEKQATYNAMCEADVAFIRPSGNPLDLQSLEQMLSSKMIKDFSTRIVSFDSVRPMCNDAAAVVTLTRHDQFLYGDTPNDDLVKWTYVLSRRTDGNWVVSHGHRATGQAPNKML